MSVGERRSPQTRSIPPHGTGLPGIPREACSPSTAPRKGSTQNPTLYVNLPPLTTLLGTSADLSGKTELRVGETSLLDLEKMGSWLLSDCGLGSEMFVPG